jgi:hypothetical protein
MLLPWFATGCSDAALAAYVAIGDTSTDTVSPNPGEGCSYLHVARLDVPFEPQTGTFDEGEGASPQVCGVEAIVFPKVFALATDTPVTIRLRAHVRDAEGRPVRAGLGAYANFDNANLVVRITCAEEAADDGLEIDINLQPEVTTVAVQERNAHARDFTLSMESQTPVANATCAAATPLSPGEPIVGHGFDGAELLHADCSNSIHARQTVWFRTTQPGRTRLVVNRSSDDLDTVLLAGCGETARLSDVNLDDAPRDVLLGVHVPSNDRTPFDLSIDFPAIGSSVGCDEAVVPTPNVPFDVDLRSAGEGTYCHGTTPDVHHRITVPPRHFLPRCFWRLAMAAGPRANPLNCIHVSILGHPIMDAETHGRSGMAPGFRPKISRPPAISLRAFAD